MMFDLRLPAYEAFGSLFLVAIKSARVYFDL